MWSGKTERSLGYVHHNVKPVVADEITICLRGVSEEQDAFGQIVEVAAPSAGGLDMAGVKAGKKSRQELRIVEVEFKENLWERFDGIINRRKRIE